MEKKHLLLLPVLCFCFLFSGCNDPGYDFVYDDNKYQYVTGWEISSDDYELIEVNDNNIPLRLEIYNSDKERQFCYCRNNGSWYHNVNYSFPDNQKDSVSSLTVRSHTSNNQKTIIDSSTIEEFLILISDDVFLNNVKHEYSIVTLEINYYDYPASYLCGNIIVDYNNDYWLCYIPFSKDCDESEERFYKLDKDSLLLNSALEMDKRQ